MKFGMHPSTMEMISISEATSVKRELPSALALTILFVLTVAVISGVRLSFGSPLLAALGLLIVALGLAPSVYYYLNGFRKSIPLIEMSCFFYVLTFGLPALSIVGFRRRPNDAWMVSAALLTIGAMCALLAGYHLANRGPINRFPSIRFALPRTAREFEIFGWCCEAAYLLYYVLQRFFMINIGSIDQLAALLGVVGKASLMYLFITRDLSASGRMVLLCAVMPFELARALATSLLAQFLVIGLLFAMVFQYATKRLPLKAIALVMLVFVFLSPVKHAYRKLSWHGGQELGVVGGVTRFVDIAFQYWLRPMEDRFDDVVDPLSRRTDHLGVLATVMSMTPRLIPYKNGETLMPLAYYWIPRIIWPDKPRAVLGNQWAKWYGFLDPWDKITSFNLPWLVEYYLNFGIYGVLICMFLTGAVLAFVEKLFAESETEPAVFCMGLGICLALWYAESNVALTWGNFPAKIIALVVISRLVFTREKDFGHLVSGFE